MSFPFDLVKKKKKKMVAVKDLRSSLRLLAFLASFVLISPKRFF